MAQNRNWLRMQYHSRILTNRTQWYSLDLFEEGNLKLHFAARYGIEKDLDNLISAGADVNATDTQGVMSLMYAVRWGQLDCIKALIREGADVNICNYIDYSTALTQVSYSFPDSFEEDGYFDPAKIKREENKRKKDNSKETIEKSIHLLIEAGADVNAVNMNGYTALTAAITVGNMDCIEALVNTGADVNTVDVNGNTALIVAAGSGCSRRSQSKRAPSQSRSSCEQKK